MQDSRRLSSECARPRLLTARVVDDRQRLHLSLWSRMPGTEYLCQPRLLSSIEASAIQQWTRVRSGVVWVGCPGEAGVPDLLLPLLCKPTVILCVLDRVASVLSIERGVSRLDSVRSSETILQSRLSRVLTLTASEKLSKVGSACAGATTAGAILSMRLLTRVVTEATL